MSILQRRLRVVRQAEAAECGLACVAMIAGAFGRDVDLSRLRHGHGASLRGMTLADVIACADALGLAARPVRAELEAVGALRLPAILHWEMTHYVVLESVRRQDAVICDPARGRRRVSYDELDRCFTGVAVEFLPTESFTKGTDRAPLRLSDLWSGLHGAVAAGGQLLILTLLLQVFTLLAPLFVQITVDEVLVYGDADLLVTLAAAFAALAVFQAVTTVLHGLCTVAIGAAFDEQANVNVLTHLLRLPLAWFEQRHVGDVLSRVGAVQPVTAFVSERLVAAFVDAAFAAVLVVILLAYDLHLAAVVLGSLGLVLALNLALFGRLRALTEETIARGARLESHLIETLRGMAALRMAGREGDRQRGWLNLFAATLDSRVRLQRLSLWADGGAGLIGGLETVVVVWLAARATLDGSFTVGMLTAFLAYRTQTVARIGALIEHAMELRMLRLHLERLSDIVHATPEGAGDGHAWASPRRLSGTGPLSVTVQELGFRYGPTQPWIFRRLDLCVEAGEWLALSGPSGCGKSTLLQVLMGQRAAVEGEVLVDGRRLDTLQLPAFRLAAAAVQQDDNLFAGSIAENITFFDTTPDLDRVHHCAALAAIDDEVLAMPMGFDTFIGDMGSALSGGQRQRVLLARALYRRPRLLLLDEATSQLDPTREATILAGLRALPLTVVMIAHRAETLSQADRVFSLGTPEAMASVYLDAP